MIWSFHVLRSPEQWTTIRAIVYAELGPEPFITIGMDHCRAASKRGEHVSSAQ